MYLIGPRQVEDTQLIDLTDKKKKKKDRLATAIIKNISMKNIWSTRKGIESYLPAKETEASKEGDNSPFDTNKMEALLRRIRISERSDLSLSGSSFGVLRGSTFALSRRWSSSTGREMENGGKGKTLKERSLQKDP